MTWNTNTKLQLCVFLPCSLVFLVKLKHSDPLPEAGQPTSSGWQILVFTRELKCVRLWGMSANPPCASCDTRWLAGFCRQSLFLCQEIPHIWAQKTGAARWSGCPWGDLDSCSQQSHGIKLWGQECSVYVVHRLKSAIYCGAFYVSLQITGNEK